MMYSFRRGNGFQSATSDVVYDGGAVYVRSTAGSLSKNLLPHEGVGCTDPIRSAAALVAQEQHRKALLKIGVFEVDYSCCRGDTEGEYGQRELRRMINSEYDHDPTQGRKRDDADAAALIDAMGGELGIPRRLADAARRRDLRPGYFLLPSHLTAAIECAADASAVLDKLSMERFLVAFVWDTIDESISQTAPCCKKRFVRVCRAAGISEGTCEAVWLEATNGSFAMFQPCSYDEHLLVREPGDVREGDVSALVVLEILWPAWYALALTSRCGGDPGQCFSIENEALYIRQNGSRFFTLYGHEWYAPLHILEALNDRRPGEKDGEPGWRRVEEALDQLLTAERVNAPLVVGGAVDYCSEWVRDRTWVRATVLGFHDERDDIVRVRLDDTLEEKEVPCVFLRSLEEPSAAAVVLALAVNDNWNRVVAYLLAHPLMRDSLSIVVGTHRSAIAPRCELRYTAMDHAILSHNICGIGLLLAQYPRLNFFIGR